MPRALTQGRSIPISPLGGAADDGAEMLALSAVYSDRARIELAPGTYQYQTTARLSAATLVVAQRGVEILSSIPQGVQFASALTANTPANSNGNVGTLAVAARDRGLSAVASFGTAPPVITLTGVPTQDVDCFLIRATLGGNRGVWTGEYSIDGIDWTAFVSAAAVVAGTTGVTINIAVGVANADNLWAAQGPRSLSINMALVPTVGNGLEILHGTSCGCYTIKAVFGTAAPWTVVVDDVVVWPFVIGDAITELEAVVHDVQFQADGTLINGQAVQMARILRPKFDGMTVVAPDTGGLGFDLGCRNGRLTDSTITIAGTTVLQNSAYMQSNERTIWRDLDLIADDTIDGAQTLGAQMIDCFACGLENVHTRGFSAGLVINTLATGGVDSFGCKDCWVNDGSSTQDGIGIWIFGASDIDIKGHPVVGATSTGILYDLPAAGVPLTKNIRHRGGRVDGALNGLIVNAGVKGTHEEDLVVTRTTTTVATLNDEAILDRLMADTSNTGSGVLCQGTSDQTIVDSTIAPTGAGGFSVAQNGTGTLRVIRTTITGAGGGAYCLQALQGTTILDDSTFIGAGATNGIQVANGAVVIIKGELTFAPGLAAAWVIAAGGIVKDQTAHAPVSAILAADIAAPGAWGDILSVNVTVKYPFNNIKIDASVAAAAVGGYAQFRILLDGVQQQGFVIATTGTSSPGSITLVLPATTAGVHTIKLQWQSPGASQIRAATQQPNEGASLNVQEVASA